MEPCCKRRLGSLVGAVCDRAYSLILLRTCGHRPHLQGLPNAIAVILFMGVTAAAQSPSIQFEAGLFKVIGLKVLTEPSAGWPSVLTVYAGVGDVPPMLGTYRVEQGALTFHPSFPIAAGVRYRVVLRLPGAAPMEKFFDGPPKETTPQARVVQIYPSSDILPSNQLRLYIYFSNPMSRGIAAQYIHVLDE